MPEFLAEPVQYMQCGTDIPGGQIGQPPAQLRRLERLDAAQRRRAFVGEPDQGGAAVCGVRGRHDQAQLGGVVHPALHRLPVEPHGARQLRHGLRAFAAQHVQQGVFAGRHARASQLVLHRADDRAVQWPQASDDAVQQVFGGRRIPATGTLGMARDDTHGIPLGILFDSSLVFGIFLDTSFNIPLNDTHDVMMTSTMSFRKGVAAERS